MTDMRQLIAATMMTCLLGAAACGDENVPAAEADAPKTKKKAKDDKPQSEAENEPARAEPEPEEAPAAAPKPSPLAAMLVGEPPAEVKLTKGHATKDFGWSIKYPAGWVASPGSWEDLLLMKRSGGAAVVCDATSTAEHMGKGIYVTEGKLTTLAKRAPIMAKALESAGDEEVLKIGKLATEVRAGRKTGNLFKADGGELIWWDVRFVQPAGNRKEIWHVYCVAGLEAGASDETRKELMAVLRSYEPPTAGSVTTPKGPPADG